MGYVYVVGTADTKGEELAYLADRIRSAGGSIRVVDVGTRAATIATDVTAAEIAAFHPLGAGAVLGKDDRGTAVTAMAEAFRSGNMGIMDYMRLKNIESDTQMRASIAGSDRPQTEQK